MRDFLCESEVLAAMRDRVLPFLARRRRAGYFTGFDGAPLRFVRYDADRPRGTVLMLHGLGECTEKYRELIYYFLKDGLSVLIYDQRGHGRSHRTVRAGLVHVRRFSDYVRDARRAVKGPLAACPSPYFLFSHSMGGAVATLLLEYGKHPFSRAILSSPMVRTFRHPHMPPILVELACFAVSAVGLGKRGVSLQRRKSEDFANSCALSRVRFDAYAALRRQRPEYAGGTITFGWTREAIGVTRRILAKGAPEGVSIPVRLYSAGRDHLVETAEQKELARRLPKGEFIPIADSKHEIYMASDDILHPYLDSVLDFFGAD